MATPYVNSIGVSAVSNLAAPGLIIGWKWGGAQGSGVTLTFSFLNAFSYLAYGNEYTTGTELTPDEKNIVRNALSAWSAVANLGFSETYDDINNVGELRFGATLTHPTGEYAHGYYPSGSPSGGDVWFGRDLWNTDGGGAPTGSFDITVALHEIGHALGLKHPFDGAPLPAGADNFFFTVMSYTASPWSSSPYASFYPTSPMYYDLVAIQSIYGRRTNFHDGNDTYTFQDGFTYFQTIDDVSGKDTIKYIGADGCVIRLSVGAFSELSEAITFTDGVGPVYSRSTVCIGPNSVIENAIGGSGSDIFYGNGVANLMNGNNGADQMFGGSGLDRLNGGVGNDALSGEAGNDMLTGGAGRDLLVGGAGADKFVFDVAVTAGNYDTVDDFARGVDKIQLDDKVFRALGAPGALDSAMFWKGAAAHDATDRLIYNRTTGDLIYDSNGSAAGGSVVIAKLDPGLTLSATDFEVI